MLNKFVATMSAATIVLFTASAAFAVPVAVGGANPVGTSGSTSSGMHAMGHKKMMHKSKMHMMKKKM